MIRTTFIIGNGFDINAGFNTKYSDFIEYYLKTDSRTPLIKEFKNNIERNKDTWADAEIAFGNITAQYRDVTDFLICYQDFCINLSQYLSRQTFRVDYTDTHVKLNMVSALLRYTALLTEAQKVFLRDKYDMLCLILTTICTFICSRDFINFNYTHVFDRCVEVLRVPDKQTVSYKFDSVNYTMVLGDVIHIHGNLSSPMLLGVNDGNQVANKEFLKNRKFSRQFIKPLTNTGLQTMRDDKAKNIIEKSDVICIFGMSLGATDRIWWQQIIAWLRQARNHYLVIFTLVPDYNPNLSSSFLDAEEDVQNRLFSYGKLTEQEQEVLRSQIFVAINKPLFHFKLFNIAEKKESA